MCRLSATLSPSTGTAPSHPGALDRTGAPGCPSVDHVYRRCRDLGMRLSRQRRMVLDLVKNRVLTWMKDNGIGEWPDGRNLETVHVESDQRLVYRPDAPWRFNLLETEIVDGETRESVTLQQPLADMVVQFHNIQLLLSRYRISKITIYKILYHLPLHLVLMMEETQLDIPARLVINELL